MLMPDGPWRLRPFGILGCQSRYGQIVQVVSQGMIGSICTIRMNTYATLKDGSKSLAEVGNAVQDSETACTLYSAELDDRL